MVGITMRAHNTVVNHCIKGGYVIKATKSEVLLFIKRCEIVGKNDLVQHFSYKHRSAEYRLYTLARQGLIIPIPTIGQWRLSKLGEKRCKYYVKKAEQEDSQ
jgi:hypothetical protein